MAHTEGPWTIHPTGAQIVGGRDGMTSVANVFGTHWRHSAARTTSPDAAREFQEMASEHDANARLIASAPDLLTALRLIQGFNWALDDTPHAREIRRRAEASIAKATGG